MLGSDSGNLLELPAEMALIDKTRCLGCLRQCHSLSDKLAGPANTNLFQENMRRHADRAPEQANQMEPAQMRCLDKILQHDIFCIMILNILSHQLHRTRIFSWFILSGALLGVSGNKRGKQ